MKRLVRLAMVVLIAQVWVVAPATAGWKFWSSDKKETPKAPQVERKVLFTVEDDQTEKELLTFLRSRELVTRDIIVLRRLVSAKQAQFADLQDKLHKAFGIKPTVQYEYDADAMVITEVTPGAKPEDKPEKKEFRKLTDKKEAAQFIEMLGLKRRLDSDIVVLQRVEKDQSDNLMEIHNSLLRKYGVRRERQYQYDRNKRILYEVKIPGQPTQKGESRDDRDTEDEE